LSSSRLYCKFLLILKSCELGTNGPNIPYKPIIYKHAISDSTELIDTNIIEKENEVIVNHKNVPPKNKRAVAENASLRIDTTTTKLFQRPPLAPPSLNTFPTSLQNQSIPKFIINSIHPQTTAINSNVLFSRSSVDFDEPNSILTQANRRTCFMQSIKFNGQVKKICYVNED
jgi:hypothetical protein